MLKRFQIFFVQQYEACRCKQLTQIDIAHNIVWDEDVKIKFHILQSCPETTFQACPKCFIT